MPLPRPVVLVNGCFDVLHVGHLQMLRAARDASAPAGCVVLALDADARIRSAKGPGRPIHSWIERATQASWTGMVTHIAEIRSDSDFLMLVGVLNPDLRVRGEHYRGKPSRLKGIPTLWVPDLTGASTTRLASRVLASTKWGNVG